MAQSYYDRLLKSPTPLVPYDGDAKAADFSGGKGDPSPQYPIPRYLVPMASADLIGAILNGGFDLKAAVNNLQNLQPVLTTPIINPCLRLKTEADVIRAAQLYIVNPIDIILSRIYATRLPGAKIYSVTEESEVDKGNRTDLAWYIIPQGGAKRCLLILEFKRFGVLSFEDWMPCLGEIEDEPEKLEEPGYMNNVEKSMPDKSTLIRNAIPLANQAVRYFKDAKPLSPLRVLLFDYRSMAVLQFPSMKSTSYKEAIGFSWLSETSNSFESLRDTNVFDAVAAKSQKAKTKCTIGGIKYLMNDETLKIAKKRDYYAYRAEYPDNNLNAQGVAAAEATAVENVGNSGAFKEMLLACLVDAIESGP